MPLKTNTPNTQAPKLSFFLDPLTLLMATKPSIRSAKNMIERSLSKLSKGKTKNYHIIDKTLSGALNDLSKAEKRALFAYLIEHDHISTILSMCDFGHFQSLIQLIDSPICILEELQEMSQEYQVITYGIITQMLSGFDSFASQKPQACLAAFLPIHERLTRLQVASICDDLPILLELMTGLTTLLTQHAIEKDEAQQQNLIQFIAHITTLCAIMILRHSRTKSLLRRIYPMTYDALVCEGKLFARHTDEITSQSLRLFRSPENRQGVCYKTGQYTHSASAHNVQSPN